MCCSINLAGQTPSLPLDRFDKVGDLAHVDTCCGVCWRGSFREMAVQSRRTSNAQAPPQALRLGAYLTRICCRPPPQPAPSNDSAECPLHACSARVSLTHRLARLNQRNASTKLLLIHRDTTISGDHRCRKTALANSSHKTSNTSFTHLR